MQNVTQNSIALGFQPMLNPRTGGYDGSRIGNLQNAVYVRIVTPLGGYYDDPKIGSRLYLLRREKDLPNRAQRAREYIAEALQPLLDAGRADAIDTVVQQHGDHRLLTFTSVYQAGVRVAHVEHFVGVQ